MKIIGWIKIQYWFRGYYMLKVKQFFCGFTGHRCRPLNHYIARCENCKKFFDI